MMLFITCTLLLVQHAVRAQLQQVDCAGSNVTCYNNSTCSVTDVNVTSCACNKYFTGETCLSLDLRKATKQVFENGIRFRFADDIYLVQYWYMYSLHPISKMPSVTLEPLILNVTHVIDIRGMESDATRYVLCIYNIAQLPNDTHFNNKKLITPYLNSSLSSCGILVTAYSKSGAFSLAFIGIAVVLALVILSLVAMQTLRTCRNHEVREHIRQDVMGTLKRIRNISNNSKPAAARDTSAAEGSADDKVKVKVEGDLESEDAAMTSRVSGIHADPSVRV